MHQPSILHRAWAEIDLSALENNVRCIQEILPEHTDFMAVVKADAYGHGDAVICTALHKMGIHWFAVSNLEEALSVRQYCPDSEIFILGYTPPELAPELTKPQLFPQNILQQMSVGMAEFSIDLVVCSHNAFYARLTTCLRRL